MAVDQSASDAYTSGMGVMRHFYAAAMMDFEYALPRAIKKYKQREAVIGPGKKALREAVPWLDCM